MEFTTETPRKAGRPRKLMYFDGKQRDAFEIAASVGIKPSAVHKRRERNQNLEEAPRYARR